MAGRVSCLAIVLGAALAASVHAQRSFVFRGTVERVNGGGTVDVKNDNIPGWMAPMSMTYRVDVPAVLKTLKGGDRITATVYEGDTSKLYKVRVATSPKKQMRERAAADFLRLPVARRRELRRRQAWQRVRNPAPSFRRFGWTSRTSA